MAKVQMPSGQLLNLPREIDLTHVENLDRVSRQRWSKVIAFTLLAQAPVVVAAIITRGFHEFHRHARTVYANQQLRTEDFRRIFDTIVTEERKRQKAARVKR